MSVAKNLKRTLTIGVAVAALTLGGAVWSAPTASAAALRSGDVGYPNCKGGCRGVTRDAVAAPASGDVGYPGCPSSCRGSTQDTVATPSSGDVGYPNCPTCRVEMQPA